MKINVLFGSNSVCHWRTEMSRVFQLTGRKKFSPYWEYPGQHPMTTMANNSAAASNNTCRCSSSDWCVCDPALLLACLACAARFSSVRRLLRGTLFNLWHLARIEDPKLR